MRRITLWLAATGIAVALALAYPTSANQGVPYGRTPGASPTKAARVGGPAAPSVSPPAASPSAVVSSTAPGVGGAP